VIQVKFSRDALDTLRAVVDAGTFEAAAALLHVTPSAVSQRIKAFERETGRVLVVRSKPIRATESGEALLRLARQLERLEHDALDDLGLGDDTVTNVPIAVNADSLATWILPPLARVADEHRLTLDLWRDDQAHTTSLLADGTVMAAITSESTPVPGCSVTPLGRMRYRAVATPAFVARWFADGITADGYAQAPVVDFDRKDDLQTRHLARVSRRALTPPRHHISASADFAQAILLGLGWGLLPDAQADAPLADGRLVELSPGRPIDVPLVWQQWDLRSPVLDAVAAAVVAEARVALR
jgi:LysR family transcriptional regulator (chromosome initiation inhibitor)